MLVVSRREGESFILGEGPNAISVTVVKINKWRWWKWWTSEETVRLRVDGPKGMSAMAQEAWERKQKARK
jgi:sRNA-binding carbon storage regulator CsrA